MNSQLNFQRMMDRILFGLNNFKCYVDVEFFSGSKGEHLKHLENVFEILNENGLRFRIKKCSFMWSSVKLLGHIVEKYGVHLNKKKISKVKEPASVHDEEATALFPWINVILPTIYNTFFKSIEASKRQYLRKIIFRMDLIDTKIFWCLETETHNGPGLSVPRLLEIVFGLHRSFNEATVTVLSQLGDNGREHPIHYASRILADTESKYSVFEREVLGVIFALRNFRHFLISNKFKLDADHKALKYGFNMKELHGRIDHWFTLLAEQKFKIC